MDKGVALIVRSFRISVMIDALLKRQKQIWNNCPVFAVAHSRQSRTSHTNAPWICLTKRILNEHDPQDEILITSAGMLQYDLVLRYWFNRGGRSLVILDTPLEKWEDNRRRIYSWIQSNHKICTMAVQDRNCQPVSGFCAQNVQEARDMLILSNADVIEAGVMSSNGRMRRQVRLQRRNGVKVRYRRLSACELNPGTEIRLRPSRIPERMPGFEGSIWHLTRSRYEPWPEETTAEYLDDLLGIGRLAPYSPEDVLKRIVDQKRMISSSYLIRGGNRVVCFTGASWKILRKMCVWQNHLRRPRFEPYGIGISKNILRHSGILPVIYGPVRLYSMLPEMMQWRFQKFERTATEWVYESEWRHLGDVDLSLFGTEDLSVLTPSGIQNLAHWQ